MKNYIRLLNIIYKIDYSDSLTIMITTMITDIVSYFSKTLKFTEHQI